MSRRDIVAAVLQRCPHSVPALTDSGIRQADGVEVILHCLNSRHIHFDLDDAGIDAVNRGAQRLIEHGVSFNLDSAVKQSCSDSS